MYTADYVSKQIALLKNNSATLSEAAWKAALLCVGWAYCFGGRGEYCTPANRRARDYVKHPTIKTKCQNFDGTGSCFGCKWYPDGKTRFYDCRGFTYWILLQIFGWKLMGGGCTSQWNDEKNWKAKGEVKDGIPQDVIVCLFYYKKDKEGNRTSTLEHTGLYYNGQTVECSNNVQHSKTLNKKWEVWGVPACVDAEVKPIPPSNPPEVKPVVSYKTIRKGNYGELVKQCQTLLKNLGYDLGICGVDGDFGSATEKAVKSFQRDHGLTVDGIVGPKTWAALTETKAPAKEKFYTVTISHLTKAQVDRLVSDEAFKDAKIVEEG